jgi:hypothetical protein
MSSIIYYSNYCDHSKKLLNVLSKTKLSQEIHFMCIDRRVKENDDTYIILENGQKIIMPKNISKVPALLLLNDNCRVLYGDNIYDYIKPKQEEITQVSTNNNMEPLSFSLGNFGYGGVCSDNFSFLDMNSESLQANGDGGLRQMHNYVALNDTLNIATPKDDYNYKENKLPEGLTLEQLQKQREQDFNNLNNK